MKNSKFFLVIVLIAFLAACGSNPDVDPVTIPVLGEQLERVIINQILTGVEGNNQADFIELYNAGTRIADLKGYSLWYQLNESTDEILIYSWEDNTLVPPLGFYALALTGEEFSVLPDGFFNQPLVPNRGALSLRIDQDLVDQVSWGSGPANLTEGLPAVALVPGSSLTRILDPSLTTSPDTNNNQTDFSLNTTPALRNSGSPLNHEASQDLTLTIDFPPVIKPGEEFQPEITIQNQTGTKLENLELIIQLPDHLSLLENNLTAQLHQNILTLKILELAVDENLVIELPLQADYTFASYELRNSYLVAANWPLPSFSGPFNGEIGGGPIPIQTARDLVDQEVVVQGISTMYVGGFYAGSGAKFYLEDESGGIQVYVPNAGNSLVVPLGSTVQVQGRIEIYRDSIELIPASEDQVQILAGSGETPEWDPETLSIEKYSSSGESYAGSLVEMEGRVARIEEFSYSYEIDLFDHSGNLVPIYLDKETRITLEELEPDQSYRITGILEMLDGNLRLYPRLPSDLARVYEPGLTIQVQPPTTAKVGEPFEVVYLVTNHALEEDHNLVISTRVDPQLEILEIHDQGRKDNHTVVWDLDKLAGGGESVSVSFLAQLWDEADYVEFNDYRVVSAAWAESSYGLPSYTFSGETVPIWAIQGPGLRSPYNLTKLTTGGVVTGVFPELEGFWIQETESDEDPFTSPGIFVRTGPDLPRISTRDQVSVTGWVREAFQQTELELRSQADLTILGKAPLPEAISLDPPADNTASQIYYEALEGALVKVPGQAVVVGPTTRYGEFSVLLSSHGVTRSWQDADHGQLIHVDDGTSLTHEYRDTMAAPVSVGDKVSGITGPLAFTYGIYKIEPVSDLLIQPGSGSTSSLAALPEGFFSIMTWNVENLFDFMVPHPSSPPLPRVSEYKNQLKKVALNIQAAGYPTIIGFQEVENLEILDDLAAEPVLADYLYQAALIEGSDSRGIDVGYLFRGDQVTLIEQVQFPAPGNITSRPPLLIELQLGNGSSQPLYVINNHFTSLSGGEKTTEPRRNAQAAWNLEIALDLLDENPLAYLAIIGDLNSYPDSLPLKTIESGGFRNLIEDLESGERYTYIYQGNSQVLDHILVNGSLDALLVEVQVLHNQADFTLPFSGDDSPQHKSDHDPVLAIFVLP